MAFAPLEEGASATVRQVRLLLKGLFQSPQAFAVTNDALVALFEALGPTIEEGLREHDSADVFRASKEYAARLHVGLVKEAGPGMFASFRDGTTVIDLARMERVIRMCPRRPTWE